MSTNPAVDVLKAERDALHLKIESILVEVKDLKARKKSIEDAIDSLSGSVTVGGPQVGTGDHETSDDPKTVTTLIRENLKLKPGMTASELASVITKGGRATGSTTVSSLLFRLKKKSLVHKRKGKWYPTGDDNKNSSLGQNALDPKSHN